MPNAPIRQFLWLSGVLTLAGGSLAAQSAEPAAGLVGLRQACLDAATDAVILNVAAHPDDESSRTNTILRRKYGARVVTAYSTYGDGGQNAIGKEIGPALARLRVRETLRAAATMDVEVRWLGMSDFGFSKTLEETLAVWGAERLEDRMRAVIDELDPDIIITNHNPTQGHGHHRASYWAVVEVLKERAERGLRVPPLYARCGMQDAHVSYDPAELDPGRGETYARLAHRAWTQHVSQGPWGAHDPLQVGKDHWRFVHPEGVPEERMRDPQSWVRQRGAADDWRGVGSDPVAVAARARELLLQPGRLAGRGAVADAVLARRIDALQRIVMAAAGVSVETWLERDEVPRGGEGRAFVVVHGVDRVGDPVVSCDGAIAEVVQPRVRRSPFDALPAVPAGAAVGDDPTPAAAEPTAPAAAPRAAVPEAGVVTSTAVLGRYVAVFHHVPVADADSIGGPEPSWVELDVAFTVDGVPIRLRPRLPYTPVDPIEVEWDRQTVFVPQSQSVGQAPGLVVERIFSATVTKHREADLTDPVRLMMGPGIRATAIPGRLNLTDEHPEARLLVRATFTPDELAAEPTIRLGVDGHTATLRIVPVEVFVPPGMRVGLVRGPDDTVERALRDLGVNYTALDRDALATTRLEEFTTLLLDMRSYHHRPELAELRDRILQFCRAGGRVVSMYHKPGEWNERAGHPLLAPFPLEIGNGRVTEEEAAVTMLNPDHRLWLYPHAIEAGDFAGWVQERGLNFAEKWDPAWTPLMEMQDSGDENPHQGALLYTQYGRGDFVYCSLVLYRQLRTGHRGAARLLVNLLAR